MPKEASNNPAKNVAVKARCRYRFGLSFTFTIFPNIDAISNDPTATVPTAKSLELPNNAYIKGGTKLESTITSQ